MFLVDWFYGVLASLGLWQKEAKILFLGLDDAGKTTLLRMLKDERLVQHQPTLHPAWEELIIGKIKFKVFVHGGHQIARRVCRDYYVKVDAVVYLMNADDMVSDRKRFCESVKELLKVLADESLVSVPFLILGNQNYESDEGRLSHLWKYRLSCHLYRYARRNIRRPLKIFMCNIVRKMGYGEGFEWLSQYIK